MKIYNEIYDYELKVYSITFRRDPSDPKGKIEEARFDSEKRPTNKVVIDFINTL